MTVSVRKLLSSSVRTSLVAAIAAVAILPAAASAEDQAGETTARVEQQTKYCREPLLDKDGRPLPGNVGGKKPPPPPPCPRDATPARTASR
jgi:hypothetical protein